MRRWLVALSAFSVLGLTAAAKPPALREVAFVANAEGGTVSLVDIEARKVAATIDINPTRQKIDRPGAPNYAQDTDVSPDGHTLYVSRGYLGDVAAFDIASGKLLWRASLDTARSDHMTVTADGKALFVSAMADNRVYRIDTRDGRLTGHVTTGVWPHDNKVSRDGKRLYNSSLGQIGSLPMASKTDGEKPGFDFQLTIADAASLEVIERIKLDQPFRPWAFTPDQTGLYAQLSNTHAVVAYDLKTRRVTKRLDLPQKPGITPADWDFEAPHHGLALTEDGKTLCLAARASDYVALVRAPQLTLIKTIPVGDAPGWAEIADHGRLCLVANTREDSLSIIDIAKAAEVARIPVGDGPKHITVARLPSEVLAQVSKVR